MFQINRKPTWRFFGRILFSFSLVVLATFWVLKPAKSLANHENEPLHKPLKAVIVSKKETQTTSCNVCSDVEVIPTLHEAKKKGKVVHKKQQPSSLLPSIKEGAKKRGKKVWGLLVFPFLVTHCTYQNWWVGVGA